MKDKVEERSYLKRWVARHILKYYIFYLHNFNRDKLKRNLLSRKERDSPSCLECGLCCVNCIAFDSKSKKCLIWDKSNNGMITRCKEFPITPIQLKLDNLEGKCRYYWD